jgi:LmbE family N-acetylglucosaminyl deacetylase
MYVLCIGAHPDDCESSIGGTAALFVRRGDTVRFLSATNGDKGHFAPEYVRDPSALARRRMAEALAAARQIGCEYRCLGWHDGEVYVDRPSTEAMIRAIRGFGPIGQGPDLIITNRPCDYHRDHRLTAQLVLDALYMLTVPLACPDMPHLRRLPVVAYWQDGFTESGQFRADIAVGIDAAIEQKVSAVLEHVSQFMEWIPYNAGSHDAFADFPTDRKAQAERIQTLYRLRAEAIAQRWSDLLGPEDRYAEAFQISDYGRRPERDELRELFPVTGKPRNEA